MHEALTEVDKARFAELTDLLAEAFDNTQPALMRASLHGRDVAVVVAVHDPDTDESIRVDPIAVLVDEGLFRLLLPPEGAEIAGGTA